MVHCLQTCMHSSHVLQDVHHLFWVSNLLELDYLLLVCLGLIMVSRTGHRQLVICLKNRGMRQVSLVKTTWVTRTNTCQLHTDLMNSSEISIT